MLEGLLWNCTCLRGVLSWEAWSILSYLDVWCELPLLMLADLIGEELESLTWWLMSFSNFRSGTRRSCYFVCKLMLVSSNLDFLSMLSNEDLLLNLTCFSLVLDRFRRIGSYSKTCSCSNSWPWLYSLLYYLLYRLEADLSDALGYSTWSFELGSNMLCTFSYWF